MNYSAYTCSSIAPRARWPPGPVRRSVKQRATGGEIYVAVVVVVFVVVGVIHLCWCVWSAFVSAGNRGVGASCRSGCTPQYVQYTVNVLLNHHDNIKYIQSLFYLVTIVSSNSPSVVTVIVVNP